MQSGRGHLSCDPHRGFLQPGSRTLSPWHSPLFCATRSFSQTSSPVPSLHSLSKEGYQSVVIPLSAGQSCGSSGPWWGVWLPLNSSATQCPPVMSAGVDFMCLSPRKQHP